MNIALIFGGQSYEHEVSLVSAACILRELINLSHTVIPIAVTKKGEWILSDLEAQLKSIKTHESLCIPSTSIHEAHTHNRVWSIPSKGLWYDLTNPKKLHIECAFPIIHGYSGEDGLIQGLLELANVPYTGCDPVASTLGMQKHITKLLLEHFDIPVTPGYILYHTQYQQDADTCIAECESQLSYPMIVKPTDGGSSIGISKAYTREELKKAIDEALIMSNILIIEIYLTNIREIETSILESSTKLMSFPPGEIIIPTKEIYDYDLKYKSKLAYAQIPAEIASTVATRIQELSEKVFKVLACNGYSRIDFFLAEDGNIYVNEINTIPGFTSISMYPKIVNQSYSTKELIAFIIENALEMHSKRNSKKSSAF